MSAGLPMVLVQVVEPGPHESPKVDALLRLYWYPLGADQGREVGKLLLTPDALKIAAACRTLFEDGASLFGLRITWEGLPDVPPAPGLAGASKAIRMAVKMVQQFLPSFTGGA